MFDAHCNETSFVNLSLLALVYISGKEMSRAFVCGNKKAPDGAEKTGLVRITTPNLKKIKEALACHNTIVQILNEYDIPLDCPPDKLPGSPEVKLVNSLSVRQVILTEDQKALAELMYRDGQTMSAIAKVFGCHYTTIGRILRRRKVPIREKP